VVSVQSCPVGLPSLLADESAANAATGSASIRTNTYSEMIRRRTGRPPSAGRHGAYHADVDGLEQQVEGPLAGAELALSYLLADASFAVYARRTAAGITRARVAEPILPALVAALWRSRDGAEPRALAVVCADDDAARALAES